MKAYPLQWPHGRPRARFTERSRFGNRTVDAATKELFAEIRCLGAGSPVLSTNIKLRLDGLPYSNQTPPADKGMAVIPFNTSRLFTIE